MDIATLRIQKMVRSCRECPHCHYDSGGVHECIQVNERVLDRGGIASFCPLPVYPSREISALQQTVRMLQNENNRSLIMSILMHAASKLGIQLRNGSLSIPLCGSGVVSLHWQMVHYIQFDQGRIDFMDGPVNYQLYCDKTPPLLQKKVPLQEGNVGGVGVECTGWVNCKVVAKSS